jgi:hypothetical protein
VYLYRCIREIHKPDCAQSNVFTLTTTLWGERAGVTAVELNQFVVGRHAKRWEPPDQIETAFDLTVSSRFVLFFVSNFFFTTEGHLFSR